MLTPKKYRARVVNRRGFEANLLVAEKTRAEEIGRMATASLGDSRWYRVEIEPYRNVGFIVRGIPAICRFDRAEDVLLDLTIAAELLGLKVDD